MADDQTISADEFLKGDPAPNPTPSEAPVTHAQVRTNNKFTPQQYNDYVRLLRSKDTTPDQLTGWFKDNGIGENSLNADKVLSFVRRNPNANIPNLWVGVPPGDKGDTQPQQPQAQPADYTKIPDWQKLPLSEINRRTGRQYVGTDANGNLIEDPNHAEVSNPPIPSWGQRFVRSMQETFSDAGTGINAYLKRANEDVREDDVIRQYGSDHNWTGQQIDDAITRAKADRGREIADIREQRARRDDDEARREGGGILGSVKRGSSDLAGGVVGDLNPTYALAPEVKGVNAVVERAAPIVGNLVARLGAKGAVPVVERAVEAAAPTAGRMAGQGVQQGGINVATQADEVSRGIKDHIDPTEVAVHSLLGAGFQGGAEALGKAAPTVARWISSKVGKDVGSVDTSGLGTLESDLALLADRGIAPDHFNNVDEIRTAAEHIRNTPAAEPEGGAVAPEHTPAPAAEEAPTSSPTEDVITRMTKAINDAGKVTTEQEQLYTQARRERLARIKEIKNSTSGESGFRAELAQLKGELPKADFQPIREQFSQEDIDSLFNHIGNAPNLTPFEQIGARTAFRNMLDGKAPTPSEIGLLNQVFPSDFMKAVASQRARGQKFSDLVSNALNLPRALMSSVDFSAPLRQGVFLVGRKEFYKAWPTMFKEFANAFRENNGVPETARGSNWKSSGSMVLDEIRSRPTYDLMERSGLGITKLGSDLSAREEAFVSQWAEKIPVMGHLVRASEAAYTGFLNKLRADTFDSLVKLHKEAGINLEFEPTVLRDIARFVNSATGRGDLPGKIGQAAPMLNGLFFSPRLIKSRIDMLNPVNYITYSPIVRREAIKALISFGAIATTVLGLASAAGMQVGTDPRSSDFGKAVSGNTHYDILGGFSQFITLGARLATNQMTTTGSHEVQTLGAKYGSPNRLNMIERFGENKAAPVPAFIMDYFRGKDAVGQPFQWSTAVAQRFTPMFLQDLQAVVSDRGPKGIAMAVPGVFGVGVNTYSQPMTKQSFQGGAPAPSPQAAPAKAEPAAPPAPAATHEPPSELSAEQFLQGAPPEEAKAPAPVPKQSTFENSIASDVISNMGLRITDNGVRSHADQERYYKTTHGAAPPGSSNHEIGNAIDIAVPHDVSVGDIVSALQKAGLKGVDIITRRHGTAPHWHIQWQGAE